ncbi:hypothetical protein N7495_005628 [Penicillium taxi]|uniref:uncharacterized protein n=1 Tax=Penicillium taxi TaxID=168475 RepID=UPI002544DC33|nr:uncharacterized protein N7495_005628 [Penicillium taxi]KAJ5893937.1 hypothetical protein N7495_005628 [Penicillium taxi]
MAESSRESQHSLLGEEDVGTATHHHSWSSVSSSSYISIPSHERNLSFSEEVFREVGLGISNSADDDTLPLCGKSESVQSTSQATVTPSLSTTPSILKSAQETPVFSQQHTPSFQTPNCPSRSTVLQKRFSWISVTIFFLAIWSTVLSGVYLAVAIRKPRWTTIGVSLSLSTVNLLCAFFAKTIELSYVTICVAFLGQALSRRALMKESRGISIADMSMRAWIMQPGSMIVHWETLRYSALSFLGAIALIATIVAMLYTTAAEALVSPKLSLGPVESTILWGKVYTSFGNPFYLQKNCQTPIQLSMDPDSRNQTCLEMEHVGSSYHNYQQWIATWADLVNSGNNMSDQLRLRPQPSGSLWDNTTITGSWIEIQNMTEQSDNYGRMVNNITMAFPHGGIPIAAMDSKNEIRQPQDASGEGKYNIEASVPSPAVNVLCVGMSKSDLDPLVYSSWPNANFNATTWSEDPPDDIPPMPSWLNRTNVDSIFGFGEKYGQRPPVFGTFPEANNTILNTTGVSPANAIYLIGKPSVSNPEYVMCAIRAKLTGVCSTKYDAASSGASLSTNCENVTNKLQYDLNEANFIEGWWASDWKNVAADWGIALSLGSGITTSQASNDRLLMQMMPAHNNATDTYSLDPYLPSVAEALAVMAGSTLILSTLNSPFVQGWNYSEADGSDCDMLSTPTYQHFTASLQAMSYSSGGTQRWQGVFYVVLSFAFLTSAICLGFIIIEARGHQVTDFTEPQNLFSLAMNSPHSSKLEGACGCGPLGHQLKERWYIGMEEDHAHYYIRAKADRARLESKSPEPAGDPASGSGYERLNMLDIDDSSTLKTVSPAVKEFRRVSASKTLLAKFY